MSLNKISIREFTAFKKLDLGFSPGVNVIVGKNSTGKSHLMKLAYALGRHGSEPADFGARLGGLFRPQDQELGRLVHRKVGAGTAKVTAFFGERPAHFSLTSQGSVDAKGSGPQRMVFLPSRELLAMFEGFIQAYSNRELSFDETYYDGCVALSGLALRGPRLELAKKLVEPIERALGGRVVLAGTRFAVRLPSGNIEAHLVSEGMRKIASLAHLILNGSLHLDATSTLFWDEPEANLNPALVNTVAQLLVDLARTGAQVVVATHDYLLTQRLNLAASLGATPVAIQFVSLWRDPSAKDQVRASTASNLGDLEPNPIAEEFARFYDDQAVAMRRALEKAK